MNKELTIDVGYVGELAQLKLTPEEATRLNGELREVVAYLGKLRNVDVTGVEPTIYGRGVAASMLRDDVRKPSLDREAALQLAPERLGDEFKVPRIVE